MVKSVSTRQDGTIRKLNVKYRNLNKDTDRKNFRSFRRNVLIYPLNELNLVQKLLKIGCAANTTFVES